MEKNKKQKYSLFNNILYVYKGVVSNKPYLLLLLIISVISTVGARFVWLYVSKNVIENITIGFNEKDMIIRIGVMTAFAIFFAILQVFVQYWVDPAAYYIRPMFMLKRNYKYFHLGFEKTEHQNVLDSLQKSINATSWPQNGVEGLIRKTIVLASELATCVFAVIVLCKRSPIMIPVVIVLGTISYFIIDKTSEKEKKYTKDDIVFEKRKEEHFKKTARDFTYGKDIRLYKLSDEILNTIFGLNEHMHRQTCKARNAWIRCDFFVFSMDMLRELLTYSFLIYIILAQKCDIAEFALYVGCVRNFAVSYQTLARVFAEMKNCNREVNDFREFEQICDQDDVNGKEMPQTDKFRFEFRNVGYKYNSAEKYALHNLNIKIEDGTKLAVVGMNGAGKTTFIKLLLRLYEPTEGEILLNGVNIKEYSREDYFSLFSPVFQDLECFAFTLAENISMKDLSETDLEKAEQLVVRVGLGEKIKDWKDGIKTNVLKVLFDDGVILSGGEEQKMGLARALYKGAPVSILDEPTAALDALAESKMYENFDEMVKGKTTVYISHRLASTKFCDVIAMFQDGEIIEYGTHQELMDLCGKYHEMFEMQAYYYKEDPIEGRA